MYFVLMRVESGNTCESALCSNFDSLSLSVATLTRSSDLSTTFPSAREAEIAYAVLAVDPEPKRSQVKKELKLNNQVLTV